MSRAWFGIIFVPHLSFVSPLFLYACCNCYDNISIHLTLLETSNLPSVFTFAECIPSGTRQINSLPGAILKTLGKKTLGKELKSFSGKEKEEIFFDECSDLEHSTNKKEKKMEKKTLPSAPSGTLGKQKKFLT